MEEGLQVKGLGMGDKGQSSMYMREDRCPKGLIFWAITKNDVNKQASKLKMKW